MNEEDNIIWNEEAQDWGYWKDGVFYEQPQYADIIAAYKETEAAYKETESEKNV